MQCISANASISVCPYKIGYHSQSGLFDQNNILRVLDRGNSNYSIVHIAVISQ